MLKRYAAFLLCAAVISVGFSACGGEKTMNSGAASQPVSEVSEESGTSDEKLKVSVSFDAMKELTEVVGKDKVEITVINPGVEGCAADFEPKAQDLISLSTAKIFVYNGLGMEPWAKEAVQSANNPNLAAVEASKGAQAIKNTDPGEIEEHGQENPHLWMSLKGAEIEAKNIKDGLVKADPSNREYYEKNCGDFVSKLESLYAEYDKKFKSVSKKSFVTGHAAFGYLCRDFGLEQNSVEDVYAEGEPSAQQLAELVKYCKKNKVTTVFVEQMASPEISKTLAKEVGAKTETIYTLESTEDGKPYLERMENNLSKIYESLGGRA